MEIDHEVIDRVFRNMPLDILRKVANQELGNICRISPIFLEKTLIDFEKSEVEYEVEERRLRKSGVIREVKE
jgi:hypothetical protein